MDVCIVRQWVVHFRSVNSDSGATELVQIFTSAACRLLFIAAENVELMVMTTLINCFVA